MYLFGKNMPLKHAFKYRIIKHGCIQIRSQNLHVQNYEIIFHSTNIKPPGNELVLMNEK